MEISMPNIKNPQEEAYFQIIRLIESDPDITQRELANRLGISLGKVNYCINALISKGWVKLQNFSANPKKAGYLYVLTPDGLRAKASQTRTFLYRKIEEYESLKAEIEVLKLELGAELESGKSYD